MAKQSWMVMDESGHGYHTVNYSWGLYSCSCQNWSWNNNPHNMQANGSWCKHIRGVNGSKVSVRQRKHGHIVQIK